MLSTASPSSSSVDQKSFKYDVFLSFRDEDKAIVDHLYLALVNKGIKTYKDDEKIQKVEKMNEQLIRSIEESRFYIIVLSKNYVSSSWCLDELVKIMECQKAAEETTYPVFFDVEPTDVRNQSGTFGEAFAKLEEKEAAGRWRDALNEAANLDGWVLKKSLDGLHEAKVIERIVESISLKLHFFNFSIDENLVGMEDRMKHIVSSLKVDHYDVRMIGIKGMGGAGKTTLARTVFDYLSGWFEARSFVENVREVSERYGLEKLQEQVLSDVSNGRSIVVKNVYEGKHMMRRMMCRKKVLLVLDDVDNIHQLEALAGNPVWFGQRSRIIITTRDEHLLVAHQVNFIYNAFLLSDEEAICLFSRYAFGREIPDQGYEELSMRAVHYSAGHPLTIKDLGSFLRGRTEREWVDALQRLKTIPLGVMLKNLEVSFDGLEYEQQEMFLDVACILKGETITKAIRMLESCGDYPHVTLKVLIQKSLITISDTDGLGLHDHLEKMGMNIVRRMHPDEPYRHSRIWIREEIEHILINDLGTEATSSIKLLNTHLSPEIIMKGLRNMKKLRFLYVDNGYKTVVVSSSPTSYDSASFPNAVRYLYWPSYPFSCLPETFLAYNLVNLEMPHSNISQLWEGRERKVE